MTDALERQLASLAEPDVPSDLAATVMARIAREADRTGSEVREARVDVRRDAWVSLSTLVAHLVLTTATAYAWLAAGTRLTPAAPRIGPGGLTGVPMATGVALAVAASLTALVLALFTSGGQERPPV